MIPGGELLKVLGNMDWDLFKRQKEWLFSQQIQTENWYGQDASDLPAGILNMMDRIQDVWEDVVDNPCWYEERWNDEDLRTALGNAEIEATEVNIARLKKECIHIFDDKSERNEMLADMAREIFK
ncbi:MAG: hypothetical protein LUE87_09915 [Lachnospiraceae bacterium]|nr:hypothetical protein [Lachnospiraceae bacterium]